MLNKPQLEGHQNLRRQDVQWLLAELQQQVHSPNYPWVQYELTLELVYPRCFGRMVANGYFFELRPPEVRALWYDLAGYRHVHLRDCADGAQSPGYLYELLPRPIWVNDPGVVAWV